MLKRWKDLPEEMKIPEVKTYYRILNRRRGQLLIKRVFDLVVASILTVLLSPGLLLTSILVKLDSKGPVLYRQVRVTQYGRSFKINKFRTMVDHADRKGSQVTVRGDSRITKAGRFLRKYRIDEIPQLLNILAGDMTFVGTRPEVKKYVKEYTGEMRATLLLPAGVTSRASIEFKDEEKMLDGSEDIDDTYVKKVLPRKMVYNLRAIRYFGLAEEFKVLLATVKAVL